MITMGFEYNVIQSEDYDLEDLCTYLAIVGKTRVLLLIRLPHLEEKTHNKCIRSAQYNYFFMLVGNLLVLDFEIFLFSEQLTP